MTEEKFFDRIDGVLLPIGFAEGPGESFASPPLDVLRYEARRVRMHWVPVLGRGLSVVAVVRQPVDLGLTGIGGGYGRLLDRISSAVDGRFPPWPRGGPGLVIGMTAVVLTPEPIGPEDDEKLERALLTRPRRRVVPLGILRVNLGQEALAYALAPAPRDLFPEPIVLADGLSEGLRRFMPPMTF